MKKACPKSGIKIHETPSQIQTHSTNMFSVDDFTNKHFSPQIATSNIDLDIDNYSCNDLFNLLGIQGRTLDETLMKSVKKVVLKTHPDKSNLHLITIYFSQKHIIVFILFTPLKIKQQKVIIILIRNIILHIQMKKKNYLIISLNPITILKIQKILINGLTINLKNIT